MKRVMQRFDVAKNLAGGEALLSRPARPSCATRTFGMMKGVGSRIRGKPSRTSRGGGDVGFEVFPIPQRGLRGSVCLFGGGNRLRGPSARPRRSHPSVGLAP